MLLAGSIGLRKNCSVGSTKAFERGRRRGSFTDIGVTPSRGPVKLLFAGRRLKIVNRVLTAIFFVLLSLSGFSTGIQHHTPAVTPTSSNTLQSVAGQNQTQTPGIVGSNQVPNLSMPKAKSSTIDGLIGAGGLTQSSAINWTLYNSGISLRLLGGVSPHDELLGIGGTVASQYIFWSIATSINGVPEVLLPSTSSLVSLGTNSSGTFVMRSMQVGTGVYSGTFKILYRAIPDHSLEWTLFFVPNVSSKYELEMTWSNVTDGFYLSDASRSFRESFGVENFTLTWDDVPSTMIAASAVTLGRLSLPFNLGLVSAGSTATVDPTVSSNVSGTGTAYTFQRHVFFDPASSNYWVFYDNSGCTNYRYSHDGISWSTAFTPPSPWVCGSGFSFATAVYNVGRSVIIAHGLELSGQQQGNFFTPAAPEYYLNGTVNGNSISWARTSYPGSEWQPYCSVLDPSQYCSYDVGSRNVNVAYVINGALQYPALSYSWFALTQSATCYPGQEWWQGEVRVVLDYASVSAQLEHYGPFCDPSESTVLQNIASALSSSVIVPIDNRGDLRVIYEYYGTVTSLWTNGIVQESPETIGSGALTSALADANSGVHVVLMSGGHALYSYRAASGPSWTATSSFVPWNVASPSMSVDYSTNNVYLFSLYGSTIIMKIKPLSAQWSDESITTPVAGLVNASYLGSNIASAGGTNSSQVDMVWTQGSNSGPYSAMFASIPIQTSWSPYSYPADPWDGNGINPYGQYFQREGESVSTSSGMLTIEQTDLRVSGRGLDLSLTRVYTEPSLFLNGTVYSYEQYPWAPLGNGWQLNFPWFLNVSQPAMIHLWDGQGYDVPSSFWAGTSSILEIHQGLDFRVVRNSTGVFLYDRSGTAYTFDPNHQNRLQRYLDPNGNTITFRYYSSNQISNITDTVGRNFQFCYQNTNGTGFLHRIDQANGSCSHESGFIRSVSYTQAPYSFGRDLISATDPIGRTTGYHYTVPYFGWLISQVNYPTGWATSYTYNAYIVGTQETSYLVVQQLVSTSATSGNPVRQFSYAYNHGLGGVQVVSSSAQAFNSSYTNGSWQLQLASYNNYTFSFAGVEWNVTDSSHHLIRGDQQLFSPEGKITKETFLLTDGSGAIGSYTNYYTYDLWGNQIYSRRMVNPTFNTSHENFNRFYNDNSSAGPVPTSFLAFQDTFSQNGGTAADNVWSTKSGNWIVSGGVYNGTETNGNQEDMLASADIGKSDISVQADVFIGSEVNKTGQQPDRIGIFTHYNASKTMSYKWALAIYDSGGTFNLGFLDEFNGYGWKASVPCAVSVDSWYTFNMNVSGTRAQGSVTGWDISTCVLSYTFSNTSPAVSGTSFGLYAGGFTALFDNVKVARVLPFITGTGFSNSFYNNPPNSNIHNALAGAAELQGGNNTTPVETYYGYFSKGELKQAKQLYTWNGNTQWLSSSRTYDSYGNLASIKDPMGNYTYDIFSVQYQNAYLTNETRVLNPGHTKVTSLYTYNLTVGSMLSSVDANGYNTTYQYDILGRVTSVNYPRLLGFVAYTYNDTANYVQTTNENGWKTRQYYDGLGRLSQTTRFLNGVPYSNESYTHNWQDRIVTDSDPLRNKITYQYDPLGRIIGTVEPNGNSTQAFFNDTASWVRYKDESSFYKCSVYDLRGSLVDVVENASSNCMRGTVTTYVYYENGDLAQVHATGVSDTYSYDSLNRVTRVLHSDGTTDTYLYDNNGHVVNWTNRKRVVTTYGYDSLNRLKSTTYNGTPTTSDTYTYDGNSNLLQLQSQNATITRVYDPRNRMTCETYQVNRGFANGPCYNGNGPLSGGISITGYSYMYYYLGENMIQLTYNDFMTANYVYDGLGRVANVSYSSPMVTTSFSYYSNDQIKGIHYANGLVQNYTYDKNSRVQQIKLVNGTSTPLLLNYQYNKTGTVSGVTGQIITTTGSTAGVSESYKYDPIGRLTNSTTRTGSTNTNLWYMYDSIGNRVAQGLNGTATGGHWQTTTYNYNSYNNELSSSSINGTTTQYGYDSNGNLLTKTIGTTTHWTYTWNVQGQLLKAANDTGAQGYYAYDGLGRRVESKENSYYVFYGYLGTETLGETGTFGPDNDYVYANGLRIAMVNDATGLHPSVVYYHTDALGSTRLVTSTNKSVLFSDSYQPYGQDNSSSGIQIYKYTGKGVSLTTGLYYDYQRWYDSSIGRFISQDPLGGDLSSTQGLNLYVYVRNSPTSHVDPTGLTDEEEGGRCSTDESCGEQTTLFDFNGDPRVPEGGGLRGFNPEAGRYSTSSLELPGSIVEPSTTSWTQTTLDQPTTTDSNVEYMNPNEIRFTHDSIRAFFQSGEFVPDVANGLRTGTIDPASFDPIRVVNYEGNLYSLDNRRLAAFQMAGVDVPIQRLSMTDPAVSAKWDDAYTTYPGLVDGQWIYIRGYFLWER